MPHMQIQLHHAFEDHPNTSLTTSCVALEPPS